MNSDKELDEILNDITVTTVYQVDTLPKVLIKTSEAKQRLNALIEKKVREATEELMFDLDEIDNKPWRVFRQLAKIMPECTDTYKRYEEFYAHGGSKEVTALMEKFEKAQLQDNQGGESK